MTNFPIVFEVEVDSATVAVEIETPEVEVLPEERQTVIFAVSPGGVDGAQGPQGPPGNVFDGVAWFYGVGPPTPSPIGAKPGDLYLDAASGTIYKLGD
jgi:hypothetical protein